MPADKANHDVQHCGNGDVPTISVKAALFNRNMLIILIGFEIFLVIIDATLNYSNWIDIGAVRRLTNIAREDGLGTWFMATQTLIAGLVLFLIFAIQRSKKARRYVVVGWLILAIFFTFMAADDASQIHERLGSAFEAAVGADDDTAPATGLGRVLEFFPSYPWQLLLMPFFAVLGLFMFNFLWRQLDDKRGRIKLVVALTCFMVAIGLDFMEGMEPDNAFNIYTAIKEATPLSSDFVDHFAKVLEEFLEMFAITFLLSAFFLQLSRTGRIFRVHFINENIS